MMPTPLLQNDNAAKRRREVNLGKSFGTSFDTYLGIGDNFAKTSNLYPGITPLRA